MCADRFGKINSWAVYYGTDRSVPLGKYDLAIVAPEAWDSASVRRLQDGGTRVLAYLSVLEVPMRTGAIPPAGVLVAAGKPISQTRWSNWVLDPRHNGAATRLLRLAGELEGRFDGLFLDTLGDVESPHLPLALRSRLLPATAGLVASVSAHFPGLALIQNWGLGALLDLTAPYLDGICWEDFPTGPPQPWQEQLADRLRAFAERPGLQVLALSNRADSAEPEWARALDFCWYGAPGTYIALAGGVSP